MRSTEIDPPVRTTRARAARRQRQPLAANEKGVLSQGPPSRPGGSGTNPRSAWRSSAAARSADRVPPSGPGQLRYLSAAHLAALAAEMRLPMAEVWEVATFYAHFDPVKEGDTPPAPVTVRVCDSLTCSMFGAENLLRDLTDCSAPTSASSAPPAWAPATRPRLPRSVTPLFRMRMRRPSPRRCRSRIMD